MVEGVAGGRRRQGALWWRGYDVAVSGANEAGCSHWMLGSAGAGAVQSSRACWWLGAEIGGAAARERRHID
ncbi:hypothetical protein TanjilG_00528 [Lupinus angustifolius]|uniref:Uncharacterized protein n=1 Tax=Lupinus angustifolius TaxID=3871 RepID=A0A4P1QXD8_LUPAN|nr:hypothetical protein TanjilG_00528 [Lupinus angustifolius]